MFREPLRIAAEAERRNVFILAVTKLPSHFRAGLRHARQLSKVRLALGLHPLLAPQHISELSLFEALLQETSYIGEVGLDFSREGKATKDKQIRSFKFVVEHISKTRKILSLHSRAAESEVLSVLQEHGVKGAIFHWYTGPRAILERAIMAGYFFSINPAMVVSKKGKEIIGAIPRDQVLTETDGPYCRVKGEGARPWDVAIVEEHLSVIWKETRDYVSQQLRSNFRRLIRDLEPFS